MPDGRCRQDIQGTVQPADFLLGPLEFGCLQKFPIAVPSRDDSLAICIACASAARGLAYTASPTCSKEFPSEIVKRYRSIGTHGPMIAAMGNLGRSWFTAETFRPMSAGRPPSLRLHCHRIFKRLVGRRYLLVGFDRANPPDRRLGPVFVVLRHARLASREMDA